MHSYMYDIKQLFSIWDFKLKLKQKERQLQSIWWYHYMAWRMKNSVKQAQSK